MDYNLKKQIVVLTGGTGGIGRVVAERFLAAGTKLFLLQRRKKILSQLAQAKSLVVDVSNLEEVKKAINQIVRQYGKIDVVVNVAAIIGPMGEFHTNKLVEWKKTLEVNLLGTVNVCSAALLHMSKRRKGKLINFAGGGAAQPFPNFSAYAASKAAVVRFTENLSVEYQKYNIQCNCVSPGLIYTKMVEEQIAAGPKKIGLGYYKKITQGKRDGGASPAKVAELILFLANPQNKLTGKLISSVWDNWPKFNKIAVKKINQTSEYTLRRIDNKYFFEK